MQFISYGGVNEYGRSCFLIELAGRRIMVDCGISKSASTTSGRYPDFSSAAIQSVDAVFITHSHEDHTLALPYAMSLGLNAPVFASAATIDQTRSYFHLWRRTAQSEDLRIPYKQEDEALIDFRPIASSSFGTWTPLFADIDYMAGLNGHAPGSLWYLFRDRVSGESVFFSGDYTMSSAVFPFDWPPVTAVDFAVLDGANGLGNSAQEDCIDDVFTCLDEHLSDGNALFHVPLAGKSQDWLYLLGSFCQQRNIQLEADPVLIHELEKIIKDDLLQKEVCDDIRHFSQPPADLFKDDDAERKIYLLTDFALLNEDVRRAEKDALFTTGPLSPTLKRYAEDEDIPVVKMPYHVHPTLAESIALYRYLQPSSFICTHAPKETAEPLENALRRVVFSFN